MLSAIGAVFPYRANRTVAPVRFSASTGSSSPTVVSMFATLRPIDRVASMVSTVCAGLDGSPLDISTRTLFNEIEGGGLPYLAIMADSVEQQGAAQRKIGQLVGLAPWKELTNPYCPISRNKIAATSLDGIQILIYTREAIDPRANQRLLFVE